MRACPVCDAAYAALPQHLKKSHRVTNQQELGLLLSMASARVKARLNCPVCDKKRIVRLDMHLGAVHNVSGKDLDEMMVAAKRQSVIRKLAELRRSGPVPPMVTELDKEFDGRERGEPSDTESDLPPSGVPAAAAAAAIASSSSSTTTTTTTSPSTSYWTTRKGRTPKPFAKFYRTPVGRQMNDFMQFFLNPQPTKKDRENAHLRRSHATRFIMHMARHVRGVQFTNLKFLYNFERLRQWPVALLKQNYACTSIKNMLLNAIGFVRHVKAFHMETSGLKAEQMERILLQLQRLHMHNSRTIRSYQQDVRRKKFRALRPSADYKRFLDTAEHEVPRILGTLEETTDTSAYQLLQGYVLGYLAVLTGHRPVVFSSMTKQDVLDAGTDDQNRTVVWVKGHKTERRFGNAFVALHAQEAGWLKRLVELSPMFGGQECPYLFQVNGQPIRKLVDRLREAWEHACMPGEISFGLIRTSVTNQAKNRLSTEERRLVAEGMCHDLATADRFYTALPGVDDAFHIRDLRMRALAEDASDPKPACTLDTSESDSEPTHHSQTDSDTS